MQVIPLAIFTLVSSVVAAFDRPHNSTSNSNSSSELLNLRLTPHLEPLDSDTPPTTRSVPLEPEETSPVDANPLARLVAPKEDGGEDVPEVQQPESCIQGVAEEPCALMDVRRLCGSAAPIGIDFAKNYTFVKVRLSLVGSNFTLTMGFLDKDDKPIPMPGKNVAELSDILNKHGCKRQWRGWVRWVVEWGCAGVFAYAVTKVLDYLPIWGMFR